jgi:hypothetical protein
MPITHIACPKGCDMKAPPGVMHRHLTRTHGTTPEEAVGLTALGRRSRGLRLTDAVWNMVMAEAKAEGISASELANRILAERYWPGAAEA